MRPTMRFETRRRVSAHTPDGRAATTFDQVSRQGLNRLLSSFRWTNADREAALETVCRYVCVYFCRHTEKVMPAQQIQYSEKYYDDTYEYRHVILPPDIAKLLPKNKLLSEAEWRNLGVQQSRGWVHYAIHRPEPHILLFRRPLNYAQTQGAGQTSSSMSLNPTEPASHVAP